MVIEMNDEAVLRNSLAVLGQNQDFRDKLLRLLRDAERHLLKPDLDPREEITGPIVDALFADSGVLQKRLANGLKFEFVYRSKIARDFVMSASEAPDHVWEPQTTRLLRYLARNAHNVAIGGAYFGDQAVMIAAEIAGQGKVHCFEPNTEQSEMLKRNVALNSLDSVVVNQIGLWSDDDVSLVLVGNDSHAFPQVATDAADGAFPTTTLNRYGKEQGVDAFQVVMLDIEGGELDALKGASNYLGKPAGGAPNVVFEIHSSYVDWSKGLRKTDIVQYLESFGYSVFAVRDYQSNVEMNNRPIELVQLDGAYIGGPPHGFNMVAVKDCSAISGDDFRFVTGVSPKLLFHRDPALHQPLSE